MAKVKDSKRTKSKAVSSSKRKPAVATAYSVEPESTDFPSYCDMPEVAPREFSSDINPGVMELILTLDKKWVNGTTLRYYFFNEANDGRTVVLANGTTQRRSWRTTNAEKDVVRNAFKIWKDVGIGLKFEEVNSRDEAEIRIGFERGDGAWSFVGRDIIDLGLGRNDRTMNFGWDLTRRPSEIDTAVHEIGHTLGFPHEHQNPIAGIVWDEEAVYAALAGSPNFWNRQKTLHNIIRKISADTVQGSEWDSNSVMHYPFGPGLINEPAQFRASGITPAGGLSQRDKTWVKNFYPAQPDAGITQLVVGQSQHLAISAGGQKNFQIKPTATRNYEFRTFGTSDTVIVLFEQDGENQRYLVGDDDSGENWNAYLKFKLFAGRKYTLRVRLYHADREEETSVMMW